jgi:hypothetical protein
MPDISSPCSPILPHALWVLERVRYLDVRHFLYIFPMVTSWWASLPTCHTAGLTRSTIHGSFSSDAWMGRPLRSSQALEECVGAAENILFEAISCALPFQKSNHPKTSCSSFSLPWPISQQVPKVTKSNRRGKSLYLVLCWVLISKVLMVNGGH